MRCAGSVCHIALLTNKEPQPVASQRGILGWARITAPQPVRLCSVACCCNGRGSAKPLLLAVMTSRLSFDLNSTSALRHYRNWVLRAATGRVSAGETECRIPRETSFHNSHVTLHRSHAEESGCLAQPLSDVCDGSRWKVWRVAPPLTRGLNAS